MRVRWHSGLVAASFALAASAADAQEHALDRGSIQVGGSASVTSTDVDTDSDDDRVTVFTLNPHLQYFVVERLAIGGDLTLSYSRFSDDVSSRTIGIGPSLTYYFGAPAATVHPYLAARVSVASVRFSTPLEDFDGSARSGSAAAGILTMLARSVGLTTELFYRIDRSDVGSQENESNTFGLAVGVAAFVF